MRVEKQLAVFLENRPGALARLSRRLAEAGINIEYAYGTATPGEQSGMLVMRVHDPERAMEVLTA
jgi:hypothetical protein